jgi:CubicO group peptidase (beta-lactamase class C family)
MDKMVAALEKLLQEQVQNKQIFNIVLAVQSGDCSFEWSGAAGVTDPSTNAEMRADSPYFIASITKIFTAAAIMLLHEREQLNLEDRIISILSEEQVSGIHYFKGKDYSGELKIFHLMNQTSGLADYFEQKNRHGVSFLETMLEEGDIEWDIDKALDIVKNDLKSKFPPAVKQGSGQKAYYSDTNYQLLGAILENVSGKNLGQVFDEFFFTPLDLPNTYLFGDDQAGYERESPATIYYKEKPLNLPKAMRSFWSDGGMVSTTIEQNRFLQALFGGEIFQDQKTLAWMQQWNKIFFPLEYGYGLMRFKLPRIFSPFSPVPEFIGHSGASGSFAFYCPERGFYLSGTVNQLDARSTSFRLMPTIANILK